MASWLQNADAIRAVLASVVVPPAHPQTDVFVGWPDPNYLIDQLRGSASRALVSIFPWGSSRLTSLYGYDAQVITRRGSTITASVTPTTVTLSGTPRAKDNVFVFVNGQAFGHTVLQSDSLTTILNSIAAAINGSSLLVTATVNGATLTVSGVVWSLSALALGVGDVLTEVSRVTRHLQLTVWAQNPLARDAVSSAVLSALGGTPRISLADTSCARLLFSHDVVTDEMMPSGILRHDLFFSVEYSIFREERDLAMVGSVSLGVDVIPLCTTRIPSTPLAPFPLEVAPPGVNVAPSGVLFWWRDMLDGTGTTFTLTYLPEPNSETVVLNNIFLERVASNPNPGQYTLSGRTITFGRSLSGRPTDRPWVVYPTKGLT